MRHPKSLHPSICLLPAIADQEIGVPRETQERTKRNPRKPRGKPRGSRQKAAGRRGLSLRYNAGYLFCWLASERMVDQW